MPSNTTTTEPSQPMTAEQLQEIQTRRDAINDTPWGTRRDENGHYTVQAGAKITPTEGFASSGTVAHIATTEDDEHGYRRADFIARAPRTIDALLAENNRLQRANTDLEQTADQALADVERLHDIADKLAYAIAPIEIIGEHSSGNDPWENALDHATPLPQVDQMRHELATRPTRAEAFREAAEIAVRVARRKNGGTEMDQRAASAAADVGRELCIEAEAAEKDEAGKDTREDASTRTGIEYGVYADGEVLEVFTADAAADLDANDARRAGEDTVKRYADYMPDAALVQRTAHYSGWTPVPAPSTAA